MEIAESMLDIVGNTPLVYFRRMFEGCKGRVAAKIEECNPSGSIKDRMVHQMIRLAEEEGRLKPGGTLVESTSGNTGAAVALAGAVLGYKTVIVTTDRTSPEKIQFFKVYGAEVIVCPGDAGLDDPESYYQTVRRIAAERPGACYLNQNANPANPQGHYEQTGPEIWRQTDGKLTHLVAGIGTGGTLAGTAKFLKEQNSAVQVIAVDPEGSIFCDIFRHGPDGDYKGGCSKVEGIGEECFVPDNLDFTHCDEVIQVKDRDALLTCRRMAREEGIVAGGSSGAAVAAALQIASRLKEGDLIVVILPDGGDRYLSKIYNDEWMAEHSFPTE
jgi:cystathionine beta-synthase